MSELVKDYVGIIKRIKEPTSKDFEGPKGPFTIHSIGLQLEDDSWHNIQSSASIEKCKEVLNKIGGGKFTEGDNVKIYEESKDGRYWKVKSICEEGAPKEENLQSSITKEELDKRVPQSVWVEKDKGIMLQVAFKGAVEVVKAEMEKVEAVDLDYTAKRIGELTKAFYKGLNKKRLELQEEGKW